MPFQPPSIFGCANSAELRTLIAPEKGAGSIYMKPLGGVVYISVDLRVALSHRNTFFASCKCVALRGSHQGFLGTAPIAVARGFAAAIYIKGRIWAQRHATV